MVNHSRRSVSIACTFTSAIFLLLAENPMHHNNEIDMGELLIVGFLLRGKVMN